MNCWDSKALRFDCITAFFRRFFPLIRVKQYSALKLAAELPTMANLNVTYSYQKATNKARLGLPH